MIDEFWERMMIGKNYWERMKIVKKDWEKGWKTRIDKRDSDDIIEKYQEWSRKKCEWLTWMIERVGMVMRITWKHVGVKIVIMSLIFSLSLNYLIFSFFPFFIFNLYNEMNAIK